MTQPFVPNEENPGTKVDVNEIWIQMKREHAALSNELEEICAMCARYKEEDSTPYQAKSLMERIRDFMEDYGAHHEWEQAWHEQLSDVYPQETAREQQVRETGYQMIMELCEEMMRSIKQKLVKEEPLSQALAILQRRVAEQESAFQYRYQP
ncbi:hypothetical protein [Marinicrinis lubricantis]|uniref:Hemerythrin-like domain-containing protein n=1 Tax=Marinicrinis lubricantis TaxID=2086470 RepID=A0ABW1ILE2_9BACL